jgi:hypothetical protein
MKALHSILLDPRRLLLLDVCLAATVLFLWFLSDGLQAQIAAGRQHFELAAAVLGWESRWLLGPWLLGIFSLLLVYLRQRFSFWSPEGLATLQERLQRATLLAGALLLLRLAALWDPFTYLFPFLTILWAPHATWALGLLFLFFVHLAPGARSLSFRAALGLASALFAICALTFALYTLYFCQVTMLHGDEGQYLMVTQSLLRDGDMDLANSSIGKEEQDKEGRSAVRYTADPEVVEEFHVRDFNVHRAPGSPSGKVHSVHPIGLSVALLPAYKFGLALWQNPRLSTALFMALVAASCLPLAFLWLVRLEIDWAWALLATLIMACTGPFFLFTNQLFPEVPALFIALCLLVALSHWQIKGGAYGSWGPWEIPLLALLSLLLACLPFLHPRCASMALLGGAGLLLQAWHSPRQSTALATIGLIAVLGLYALVSFNYAFSNDWLGPFRPGNAWEKGALDPATWAISLPGHWLHVGKGILNSSPVYFFSLLGWSALALWRDRRFLLVLALYGATAATNGLHPDWGFGFCFPARFLVTALPALLLGLGLALPLLGQRAATAFLLALSLTIGLESVLNTVALTETGYDGRNLLGRHINHYYPLNIHFFPPEQTTFPFGDLAFWALLAAALVLGVVYVKPEQARLRWSLALAAALLPFLWGRTQTMADRLDDRTLSPHLSQLVPGQAIGEPGAIQFAPPPQPLLGDIQQPDGRLVVRQGAHPAALINSSYMPFLMPGIYRLELPDLSAVPDSGQVSGHLIVPTRYSVPAVSRWETRLSRPLVGGDSQAAELIFRVERPLVGYIYVEFSGSGALSFRQLRLTYFPSPVQGRSTFVHRFAVEPGSPEEPIVLGASYPSLPAGHYRVLFDVQGSAFSAFFERQPAPLVMAVYAGPVSAEQLHELVRQWFTQDRVGFHTVVSPQYVRPLIESVQPPWWLSMPFGTDTARQLDFAIAQPQDVWFLMHYAGPADLRVNSIALYREHFDDL